jgi:hypothetical protein
VLECWSSEKGIKWGNLRPHCAFHIRISPFLLASHSSFLRFTGNNCYSQVHFEHISTPQRSPLGFFASLRCPHVVHNGEMSHHVDLSTSTMLACLHDGLLILSSPIHGYIHSLRRQRRSCASSAWVHREPRMRKLSSVRTPRFALSDRSRIGRQHRLCLKWLCRNLVSDLQVPLFVSC